MWLVYDPTTGQYARHEASRWHHTAERKHATKFETTQEAESAATDYRKETGAKQTVIQDEEGYLNGASPEQTGDKTASSDNTKDGAEGQKAATSNTEGAAAGKVADEIKDLKQEIPAKDKKDIEDKAKQAEKKPIDLTSKLQGSSKEPEKAKDKS